MADAKERRTLYFLPDGILTEEHKAKAEAIGGRVMFRNSTHIPPDGPIEPADAVAGDVPERYKKAFANPQHPEHANAFSRGASPQRPLPNESLKWK